MYEKSNISIVETDGQFLACYRDTENEVTRYFNAEGKEVELPDFEPPVQEGSYEFALEKISPQSDIIEEVASQIKKCVYLKNEEEYFVIALMIILSYCVDLFNRVPYLSLQGLKGTGKTTLMAVMKSFVYRPVFLSDASTAALFRIINELSPTLFIDEVENLKIRSGSNNQIFEVLNSGYQKDGVVARVDAKKKVVRFKTYGFKILAGINSLFEPLQDRCILINLEQPPKDYVPEPFPNNAATISNNILFRLMQSSAAIKKLIVDPTELKINAKIRLRELDKWFPILVLAKVFSNKKNDYFSIVEKYAVTNAEHHELENTKTPENMCKAILKDFLLDNSAKAKLIDKNFFYFKTETIQKVIQTNDLYNTYRNKADFTLTLKKIGVEIDRKRFGKGPETLYKLPKSFLN